MYVSPHLQIGLLATDSRFSVTLPGSGDGSRVMATESNIQKPGKWTFRVDLPQIITCPAGFTGPPYCLQGWSHSEYGRNGGGELGGGREGGWCDDSLGNDGYEGNFKLINWAVVKCACMRF